MEYENHGMRWSVTETKQLLKETRKFDNLDSIALIHKRSPYAIYLKLVKEASKIADEDYDISLKDLAEIVGLKPQALLDGFKKIKYEFKNDDKNDKDEDYIYNSEEDEEEVVEVEVIKQEKKVEILPAWASVVIILVNLSGLYYFFMMNKLI